MKVLPQLTEPILDEFVQFKGDMIAYLNSGRGPLKFDWDRIDELLQDIFLVRAGLASDAFRARVDHDLEAISLDGAVRNRLWELAAERVTAAHRQIVF